MVNVRYTLPKLPYPYDMLEPVISEKALRLHHDKHHRGYVNGAGAAIERLEQMRADEITDGLKGVLKDLSFNVSGHELHSIFWSVMRAPKKRNAPSVLISRILDESFGCFDNFKREFTAAAISVEGSGWATLSRGTGNELLISQVEKHNVLGIAGYTPVLVLDVWEHAYYLDYQNDRAAYADAWWDIVNWDEVEQRLVEKS